LAKSASILRLTADVPSIGPHCVPLLISATAGLPSSVSLPSSQSSAWSMQP
jgi:hypothetical protein